MVGEAIIDNRRTQRTKGKGNAASEHDRLSTSNPRSLQSHLGSGTEVRKVERQDGAGRKVN